MSDEKPETTVPPGQDDSGAATPPAGTLEPGNDRDASGDLAEELRRLKEERKLYLEEWKPKVERVNEVERELADLKARLANPSPTMPDARAVEQTHAMNLLAQQIQEAEFDASRGDTRAALLVATLKQQYALQQQVAFQFQMQQIPPDHRNAVMAKLQTGRYADVMAAYESVENEILRSQAATIKKREEELAALIEARNRGVVGSGPSIPVTKREESGDMTMAEYAAKHDQIFSEKGPEAARAYALKAQDLGNGKVRVA